MSRFTVHHIPVCPFCQRLEILLALKGLAGEVDFRVVDITQPRPPELQRLMRGTTSLPVLVFEDGRVLKESLVILQYLEATYPVPAVAQSDPWLRALENLLCTMEGPFVAAGYTWVMSQDPAKRDVLRQNLLALYAKLDDFLVEHAPDGGFLFEDFGWAEAVFTPMFMRFWFLGYYEGFDLPDEPRYARVRRWRDACLAHPAAQQVCEEEIVKLYYDYAKGAGNGALLPGRTRSSFAFEPHWRSRPWPPRDKYAVSATDAQLGLLA
ncbi:MAG: glutathione S-transferase family protein [Burkholderiales bacterium]|nr:glutathione S-transferase family protein [Burkholderiales bacterium]